MHPFEEGPSIRRGRYPLRKRVSSNKKAPLSYSNVPSYQDEPILLEDDLSAQRVPFLLEGTLSYKRISLPSYYSVPLVTRGYTLLLEGTLSHSSVAHLIEEPFLLGRLFLLEGTPSYRGYPFSSEGILYKRGIDNRGRYPLIKRVSSNKGPILLERTTRIRVDPSS